MMKSLIFILWICLLAAFRAYGDISPIDLQVGEFRVLPRTKEFRGSLTLINPKVVQMTVQPDKIKLVGLKPGEAHLIQNQGQRISIVVYSAEVREAKEVLRKKFEKISGIEVLIRPKKIILRGLAQRISDWKDVQILARKFKIIENQVTLETTLISQLKSQVESSIKIKSINSAHLLENKDRLTLVSTSKKQEDKVALKEIAQEWGLDPPEISQNIELRPMIEIDIVIAEIKKNNARHLGLQLPESFGATLLPSSDLSSMGTSFDPINTQFHASLTDSMGKVLANPKLLCRSGESAHFVAGGEIPIKIHSRMSADVIWKRYGVILDITPVADENSGISTGLVTEISLLDSHLNIDGIPGLLTNRIETHFDIQGSKTIALSGLIKSEKGQDSSTLPFLGEIPILGELFKSRDFNENRTELVVFVTPRVISPKDPTPVPPLPAWEAE